MALTCFQVSPVRVCRSCCLDLYMLNNLLVEKFFAFPQNAFAVFVARPILSGHRLPNGFVLALRNVCWLNIWIFKCWWHQCLILSIIQQVILIKSRRWIFNSQIKYALMFWLDLICKHFHYLSISFTFHYIKYIFLIEWFVCFLSNYSQLCSPLLLLSRIFSTVNNILFFNQLLICTLVLTEWWGHCGFINN